MTKRHPARSTTVVGPPKTLIPIGCLLACTVPTAARTQPPGGIFRSPRAYAKLDAAPFREQDANVSDALAIGCVGTLTVATRGDRGTGEVLVTVRGSKETFLAWSEEPLPKGATVLVVEVRGPRTVLVEPWSELGRTSPGPTDD